MESIVIPTILPKKLGAVNDWRKNFSGNIIRERGKSVQFFPVWKYFFVGNYNFSENYLKKPDSWGIFVDRKTRKTGLLDSITWKER